MSVEDLGGKDYEQDLWLGPLEGAVGDGVQGGREIRKARGMMWVLF